ncbi:MAG: histidine phosphatase family protein [Proteobacteria bacterium]|nr:histidine phosphatase family protein [Pseudomonadota bacterium]
MSSIYLVRHGDYRLEPVDGSGRKFADRGLSALGRRQADALRRRLAASPQIAPIVLYTSTLPRALQTAEIIASAYGLQVVAEPDLEEWRSGNDDMPLAEFIAEWSRMSAFDRRFRRFRPGCETGIEFDARARSVLHRIVTQHAGDCVMIVAHGGIMEAAFRYFIGLGDGGSSRAYPACGHTSLTHWRRDPDSDEWVLEFLNDGHHLDGLAAA